MSSTQRLNITAGRLVLTFDAFGTLYKPRRPLHDLYNQILKDHRLPLLSKANVKESLPRAFKAAQEKYPFYGKHHGVTTEDWWAKVTHSTLQPHLPTPFPPTAVEKTWRLFGSTQGWALYPDVLPFFSFLRDLKFSASMPPVIVGIITNSDDRVPSILRDMGLRVNTRRYHPSIGFYDHLEDNDADIDFMTMSYDVEHSKPDPEIFKAAYRLSGVQGEDVQCIHVGDNLEEDVKGAERAGWQGVLLQRKAPSGESSVDLPAALHIRSLGELQGILQQSRLTMEGPLNPSSPVC